MTSSVHDECSHSTATYLIGGGQADQVAQAEFSPDIWPRTGTHLADQNQMHKALCAVELEAVSLVCGQIDSWTMAPTGQCHIMC